MFTRLSSRYSRPSTSPKSRPCLSAACLGRYAAVWAVCGLTVALGAQSVAPFNDSIRVADLRADLFFLAGDGFKGRLVGTPENALAAEWVRSRFERAGLKPGAPNGSFVQNTQLMVATLGEGSRMDVALGDGTTLSLGTGQDFYPQRFSASSTVKAAVVYAGFGIHAPKLQYRRLRRSA